MNVGWALLDGLAFLTVVLILGAAILALVAPRAGPLLAPAVGIAAAALLVNGLYFGADLTVRQCSAALLLCTLAGAAVMVRTRSHHLVRPALKGLVLYLVLSLPLLLGRLQYCVFRGNHWDHFNYIDMAIAMSLHRHSELIGRPLAAFIDNDVVVHGIGLMGGRPAAPLLFAVFLPWGLGDLHLNAFAWNTALWTCAFPSTLALWQVLHAGEGSARERLPWPAPVLALMGGFWGQYIFDINAWSQLAVMPVMIAVTVQFTRYFAPGTHDGLAAADHAGSDGFLLALLIAAAFLIYPEQTVLQAGVTGSALLLHLVTRRQLPPWRGLFWLLPSMASLLAIAIVPNVSGTLGLVVQQIHFGSTGDPDWYRYFDSYWLGMTGSNNWLDVLLNFPIAVTGMFPMAWASTGESHRWLRAVPSTLICSGLMLAILLVFVDSVRWRSAEAPAVQLLRWLALACAGLVAWMLLRHHIWVAGKALSYFVPYLLLPMCLAPRGSALGIVRRARAGFLFLFIACQLGFAVFRPVLAMTLHGVGYAQNRFPSIQDVSLKTTRSWRMDSRAFRQCHQVAIADHVSTVRTEFVKQRLSYAGIAFSGPGPVTAHYQPGAAVIGMPASPPADCALVFVQQGEQPETVEMLPLPFCDWFQMDRKGEMLGLEGFGQPEGWGVWTAAPLAHVRLPVALRGQVTVELDIGMVYPASLGKTVRVGMGGTQAEFVAGAPGIQRLLLDLGDEPSNTIDIAIPVTETPASRGESSDPRLLGIGLTRLRAGACEAGRANGMQR